MVAADMGLTLKKKKTVTAITPNIPPGITKCKRCRHVLSVHEVFASNIAGIEYAKCNHVKCACYGPLSLLPDPSKQATVKQVAKYRTLFTYPDIRAGRKTPPLWMAINLSRRLCWCGKPKKLWDKYRRKFCSGRHSDIWHYHVIPWWPTMRGVILERDDCKCAVCGRKSWDNEVDHVVPKATDPDMFWYENNLRVLCDKCHHRKTGQDIRNINIKKRGAKHVPLSNFFSV